MKRKYWYVFLLTLISCLQATNQYVDPQYGILSASSFPYLVVKYSETGTAVVSNQTTRLDLGTFMQNDLPEEKSFSIKNISDHAIQISGVSVNSTTSVAITQNLANELAAGQESDFSVKVLTSKAGVIQGRINITIDGKVATPFIIPIKSAVTRIPSPTLTLTLNGTPYASGSTYTMPGALNGTDDPPVPVLIKNTGDKPLVIASVSGTNNTGITMTPADPSQKTSLDPNDMVTYNLKLPASLAANSYAEKFVIVSNDSGVANNQYILNVSALVTASPTPLIVVKLDSVELTAGQLITLDPNTLGSTTTSSKIFEIFNAGSVQLSISQGNITLPNGYIVSAVADDNTTAATFPLVVPKFESRKIQVSCNNAAITADGINQGAITLKDDTTAASFSFNLLTTVTANPLTMQTFLTAGPATYTIPAGASGKLMFEAVGGGGGGGGSGHDTGNGGGAGTYETQTILITASSSPRTISISVGSAGAGGGNSNGVDDCTAKQKGGAGGITTIDLVTPGLSSTNVTGHGGAGGACGSDQNGPDCAKQGIHKGTDAFAGLIQIGTGGLGCSCGRSGCPASNNGAGGGGGGDDFKNSGPIYGGAGGPGYVKITPVP